MDEQINQRVQRKKLKRKNIQVFNLDYVPLYIKADKKWHISRNKKIRRKGNVWASYRRRVDAKKRVRGVGEGGETNVGQRQAWRRNGRKKKSSKLVCSTQQPAGGTKGE